MSIQEAESGLECGDFACAGHEIVRQILWQMTGASSVGNIKGSDDVVREGTPKIITGVRVSIPQRVSSSIDS